MKLIPATFALVLAAPFLRAQAVPEPPLISTSGTAEVKVVPDLADLLFEVGVRNADLATARKEQAARASKVIAALRAAGVAEADLQAADISISPNYTEHQPDRVETSKVRFFAVAQSVAVTLRDVKKVPGVIAAAGNAGTTGMQGVSLRTSELRQHRDAARAHAIKAAKEKAVALAAELGAKVGKPYRITEEPVRSWGGITNNSVQAQTSVPAGGDSDSDGATFAIGTISISATVGVAFLLE